MMLMMYLNQSIVSLGKASGWFTESVIDHNIDISKYNPLDGSNHMKLTVELNNPKKV